MVVVLGTSCGFVTTAPTANPNGTFISTISSRALNVEDTSDASAVKITEIGWWSNQNSQETNFEVGLYASDGSDGVAGTLLQVSRTNAKGTTTGWITTTVDWDIDTSTTYWIAVQVDTTATATRTAQESSGSRVDALGLTTLPDPFGGGTVSNGLYAIYALWEAASVGVTIQGISSISGVQSITI